MKLSSLLVSLPVHKIYGSEKLKVSSITEDSRTAKKGSLFVAINGLTSDGHKFISQAVEAGARVVVGEKKKGKIEVPSGVTYVEVPDSRVALGHLASTFYGFPSQKLKIIGVTGTDGKTTTANLIYQILTLSGKKVGLVSTIGAKIGQKEINTGLHVTSPDPVSLHALLAEMVRQRCEYAVLEVTSHAIDQERIAGVEFTLGVLTNITHEHLDYHKSFEAYRQAKSKLFRIIKGAAILSKDDPSYEYIFSLVPEGVQIISYGIKERNSSVYAQNIQDFEDGQSFEVVDGVKAYILQTKLLGKYNVLNILAAISSSKVFGIEEKNIKKAVSMFEAPSGRLEKIDLGQDFDVYVDFAHTPNSLKNVLALLKGRLEKKGSGRLIAVFGCAGERDIEKRSMMGEISAKLADVSIFTAEDPRSEDVNDIISEMVKGAKKTNAQEITLNNYYTTPVLLKSTGQAVRGSYRKNIYFRIPERGEAIAFSVQKIAQKGDIVVVCGKGHEKSMAYAGVEHPWSDQETIREVLEKDGDKVAVVLAAGLGKRMKSDLPKVLHKIAGQPMLSYSLRSLRKAKFGKIIVVVGHKKELIMEIFGLSVDYAVQKRPLGTSDALLSSLKLIPKKVDSLLVVNGDDSAFYKPETLNEVLESHKKHKADLTFVTYFCDDPTGLGRIVRENGKIKRIVEEKEVSDSEKKVKEVNINFFVFNRKWLMRNIKKVKKSPSGEYYIVDLVGLAISQDSRVNVYKLGKKDEWVGVNTPEQLKVADEKKRESLASFNK